MASFEITDQVRGDVAIVSVKGDVTPGKIEGVLSSRMLVLVDKGYKKLVLNLEGLPTIDSVGLGEIVRTYTSIMRQGAKMKVAAAPKKIMDLLRVTRLILAFEVEPSIDEAVAKFQ